MILRSGSTPAPCHTSAAAPQSPPDQVARLGPAGLRAPRSSARALAEELEIRPLQARCHLSLGTLAAQGDRLEQARAALSTASALFRAMEMPFWLHRAEAALAQVAL